MDDRALFLPVSREDMEARGWYYYDFLLITGDAYVDHPSFGVAVIGRCLEDKGYRVAVLAQPDVSSSADFLAMGRPRYAALVSGGNIDSMVAHYTAAKKRRHKDSYSPGGEGGRRPDRAVIRYAGRVREAFPGLPICLGGLEASLRRFTHYDYWDDAVRRPILLDAKADILMYGMGERHIIELADRFKAGKKPAEMGDVRGICYLAPRAEDCLFPYVEAPSHEEQLRDKSAFARAAMLTLDEQDAFRGRAVVEPVGGRALIQTPPSLPLSTEEFDRAWDLPYTRRWHPDYDAAGGVPALSEVEFSVIHNRGCFGGCNFCSLAFHQGRFVSSRSHRAILKEVEAFTHRPNFKGYVHDVGGPTANFRHPSCKKQKKSGLCRDKRCLFPEVCPSVDASHADYLRLLREISALPGVKKVFVRSGLRFDYLLADKSGEFFGELVKNHVSGQLKVAPEHISDNVLYYMGKPKFAVYEKFCSEFKRLNQKFGKEQYLVPYLMSSHPGSTLEDAILLAQYLNKIGHMPEQVQDFYPTPGTLSTAMYYSGIDPRTMEPVYVPKTAEEKAMQRALLQWRKPENRRLVEKALRLAGREDLIGYGKGCLLRPASPARSTPRPGRGDAPPAGNPARWPDQGRKTLPLPAANKAGKGPVRGKASAAGRPSATGKAPKAGRGKKK